MGFWEYEPLAARHRIPITVTGFEPLDLLQGAFMTLKALEEGRWGVENQYRRAVTREGNRPAQELLAKVFEVCDRPWRGIGTIPGSGLALREELARHDAARRFPATGEPPEEPAECIAGEILRGLKKPHECSAFGGRCTPERPLGAPMVSSEGACAAYHRYGRA
jgi:hydrogenase expression/formation protein HypD